MNSLQGHLLIASPRMDDPRFDRTVILVLRHDEDGAMGVILNRPLPGPLSTVSQALEEAVAGTAARVHNGGPVSGPLIALRPQSPPTHQRFGNQMRVEAEPTWNDTEESDDEDALRVFVGHSGWESGQLEAELQAGVWFTLPASPAFVFGDEHEMWVRAVRESGQQFYRDVLNIDKFPRDATWN